MTKTLTEQWREGTLDNGYYYVRSGWSTSVETRYLGNGFFEGNIEVLISVPSYDEYKQLVSKTDQLEKHLEVSEKEHYRTLEQLRIATGALREYANCKPTEWMSCVTADKALKEMEGVK